MQVGLIANAEQLQVIRNVIQVSQRGENVSCSSDRTPPQGTAPDVSKREAGGAKILTTLSASHLLVSCPLLQLFLSLPLVLWAAVLPEDEGETALWRCREGRGEGKSQSCARRHSEERESCKGGKQDAINEWEGQIIAIEKNMLKKKENRDHNRISVIHQIIFNVDLKSSSLIFLLSPLTLHYSLFCSVSVEAKVDHF